MPPPDPSDSPGASHRVVTGPLAGVGRLLVVRLDNVGDAVLLGPALRAVRAALPLARIDLLASRAGALAVPLLPWIDGVHVARVPWQDAAGDQPLDPDRELALIGRIREGAYDAAIVFGSFAQTAWPAAYALYLAGVPIRAAHAVGFGGSVLTHPIAPPPYDTHEAERNLALVEALGVPVDDRGLEIRVASGARTRAADLLAAAGVDPRRDGMLLVAPGASCQARRWRAESYGDAAAAIARAAGVIPVVTGSDGERELAAVVAAHAGGVSLAGETDVSTLAALVEAASLVVTGNSLVLHLADALRRPVAALYSGTDLHAHWRPRATRHMLLDRPVPCAPCHRFECPIGQPCLAVSPEEVAGAGLELLDVPAWRAPWLASAS